MILHERKAYGGYTNNSMIIIFYMNTKVYKLFKLKTNLIYTILLL
jgi:hypothetical protein